MPDTQTPTPTSSRLLCGIVRYDGTNFAGWQIQAHDRTVQGELQRVLSLIARKPVKVSGASRTDAGVHALGQVCSFHWEGAMPLERLRHKLSMMLSPEIRVTDLQAAPDGFSPRYHATGKRYAYTLCVQPEPDPFAARYSWHFRWKIDRPLLDALLERLTGTHDFAGFQSSGATVERTDRTIHSIRFLPGPVIGPTDNPNLVRLEFHGNGFLYKMIRNITGTVMDIARRKLPESTLEKRLHASGPYLGYTAPACGLTLLEVQYPQEIQKAP